MHDHRRLAVDERDKLNGPAAEAKRIYTVGVPDNDVTGQTGFLNLGSRRRLSADMAIAVDTIDRPHSTHRHRRTTPPWGPRLPDAGQSSCRGCAPDGPVHGSVRRPNQSERAAPPCSPRLRNSRWGVVTDSRMSAASRGMPARSATAGTRPPTYSTSAETPCTRIRAGDRCVRALLGAQPRSMAMPRGSSTAVNRPVQHHRKTAMSHSLSALPRREVCPARGPPSLPGSGSLRALGPPGHRSPPPRRLAWSFEDRARRAGPRLGEIPFRTSAKSKELGVVGILDAPYRRGPDLRRPEGRSESPTFEVHCTTGQFPHAATRVSGICGTSPHPCGQRGKPSLAM
ncbi:hypothetical protein StrepF001_09980 [Streptomyces sp. F001]|nr:hypothetical protein StrepF001_09980 [Streptomyces sp. F001]